MTCGRTVITYKSIFLDVDKNGNPDYRSRGLLGKSLVHDMLFLKMSEILSENGLDKIPQGNIKCTENQKEEGFVLQCRINDIPWNGEMKCYKLQ